MVSIRITLPAILVAMALLALTACSAGTVEFHDARIRLLPGDRPLAGYVTVVNNSAVQVTITGADSPDFGMVMLHRSLEKNGQSTMGHVDQLPVASGATLHFEPGGYHLMLMQARRQLAVGDSVPITINFADGSHHKVTFIVRGATTQ